MEDDEKLSDEELAQVVEDEVLEMDYPQEDIRSRLGNIGTSVTNLAQDARGAIEDFKAKQELKRQENEELEFEKAKQKLEEARKLNELSQLKEQARSIREQAEAPQRQRMEKRLSTLKNVATGIGQRFMARTPSNQRSYAQPQTPPAFAPQQTGSILFSRQSEGRSWLSSGNGGVAPFLQQQAQKPFMSWLSSGNKGSWLFSGGNKGGGSWLFGSQPKRVKRIRGIRRVRKRR
jgi:hypothetical protein